MINVCPTLTVLESFKPKILYPVTQGLWEEQDGQHKHPRTWRVRHFLIVINLHICNTSLNDLHVLHSVYYRICFSIPPCLSTYICTWSHHRSLIVSMFIPVVQRNLVIEICMASCNNVSVFFFSRVHTCVVTQDNNQIRKRTTPEKSLTSDQPEQSPSPRRLDFDVCQQCNTE